MTKLTVKMRPVKGLIPYARNARTHPEKQVKQLAASISEFGFNNPVLIDERGGIVAGHGRVLAAEKLGLEKVPTITLTGLTKNQRRAFTLADNRIADSAGWDNEMLVLEMADLSGAGFDLALTGFKESEINALFTEAVVGDAGEDETPEASEAAVSRPGDLWHLGAHRVLCGDATEGDQVEALLAGAKPNLMVTDPPYGVEYDPAWRVGTVGNGARSTGRVANDDLVDWSAALAHFPGDVAYVWYAAGFGGEVEGSLKDLGFEIRAQIIWAKQHFAISRGHYHWQHEPCWYVVRKGRPAKWRGGRKQSTLWQVPNNCAFGGQADDAKTNHGTQKPVEIMRRPIINHTRPGEPVFDPFLGSGTTLIAASGQDRVCFGMEIEPAYVDVIVRRWQGFNGGTATLGAGGKTFAQLTKERVK